MFEAAQVQEATRQKVEMSREVASLRGRLTVLTQQAEDLRSAAESSPDLAKQHDAALAGLKQEVRSLQEQLAQAQASRHPSFAHCRILRDRCENLFQVSQGDAMILFMWQDDIVGVVRFIDPCSERVYTSAGPLVGDQASDQPCVGWERCDNSSSSAPKLAPAPARDSNCLFLCLQGTTNFQLTIPCLLFTRVCVFHWGALSSRPCAGHGASMPRRAAADAG